MKAYGVITVVLLVGLVWLLGMPPAAVAAKKTDSEKPPAVEKSPPRLKPFLAQWWRNEKRREMLKLTDNQVKLLEAVVRRSNKKRRDLNEQRRKAQQAFNRLMRQGEFKSPRMQTFIDEMVAARTGLIENRIKDGISVSEILSPEQLKTILKNDPNAFHYERPLLRRNPSGGPGRRVEK